MTGHYPRATAADARAAPKRKLPDFRLAHEKCATWILKAMWERLPDEWHVQIVTPEDRCGPSLDDTTVRHAAGWEDGIGHALTLDEVQHFEKAVDASVDGLRAAAQELDTTDESDWSPSAELAELAWRACCIPRCVLKDKPLKSAHWYERVFADDPHVHVLTIFTPPIGDTLGKTTVVLTKRVDKKQDEHIAEDEEMRARFAEEPSCQACDQEHPRML